MLGYTRGFGADCLFLPTGRSAFRAVFAAFSPARRVDSRKLMILLPFGRVKDRITGSLTGFAAMSLSMDRNIIDPDPSGKSNRRIETMGAGFRDYDDTEDQFMRHFGTYRTL